MEATSYAALGPTAAARPTWAALLIYLFWQILILALLAAAPISAAGQGQRYHVSTGGSDSSDGSSWSAAFQTLEKALDAAGPGDEIWMASGIYVPSAPAGRNATFDLGSGREIQGGFRGTESDLSQRICSSDYETVLSGDLGAIGNAYHVVSAVDLGADALLECIVIQDGAANGPSDHSGGGLYAVNSDVHLADVTLRTNSAAECGGGMYFDQGSQARLTNVTFKWNSARLGGGFCNASGDPFLLATKFNGNFATSGGGMYHAAGTAVLDGVEFTSNGATNGGGLNGQGAGKITILNAVFSRNSANSFGAGIYNGGTLDVEATTFSSNTVRTSTTGGGGGLYNAASGVARVARSVFSRNDAASRNGRGGAVYQAGSGPSELHLWNSVLVENDAGNGGAVFVLDGAAKFVNVTISENDAREEGGAMFLLGGRTEIYNSILWNNQAYYDPEILLRRGTLDIETGIITGGCPDTFTTCANILHADPLFEAEYAPAPQSPAVDAGDSDLYDALVPVSLLTGTHVDLSGKPRVDGEAVDLGALEQGPGDSDGDGIADEEDECPGTTDDPVESARPNHWYLAEGSFIQAPPGAGSKIPYTTADTRGCSCAQILAELDLGNGKPGCSNGVMRLWVDGGAGKQGAVTETGLPRVFELGGNYPNPFNPTTLIRFAVPERSEIRLAVYDLLGREVSVLLEGTVGAGYHEAPFDAGGLASGGYLYRLTTPGGTYVRLMTLLR